MLNKKYYYILSLFFAFGFPAIIELFFIIKDIDIANYFILIFGILILGSFWDIWATRHGRRDSYWLWQFNFRETLGIKLFGLPIEEYLFYIFSSTYIIFTWEAINKASKSGDIVMRIIIPMLAVWTLLAVIIPIVCNSKDDRLRD